MKILAGVVLAGAVAAGVAVISGGGDTTPLPAASPEALQEHPHDQKFKLVPVVGVSTPGWKGVYGRLSIRGVLDGPGAQADYCSVAGKDADAAGNAFWMEHGGFSILRRWDRETGLVTTVAGSAYGDLDGPLGRARFSEGAGAYGGSGSAHSADGKHVFVRSGGKLRHVDLEAGTVSTMGNFMTIKEKSGAIYVFDPAGGAVPPGEGYTPLAMPRIDSKWLGGCVYDRAKGRIYAHRRYQIYYLDAKTGKFGAFLTLSQAECIAAGLTRDRTGPLKTACFQCPGGISISPGGRYLYVGGGDSYSFWRLDLEKEYVHIFGRLPDGSYGFRDGPSETSPGCMVAMFPGHPSFAADGSACWGTASGIFLLDPVK